jgi:ribosome-associated protein
VDPLKPRSRRVAGRSKAGSAERDVAVLCARLAHEKKAENVLVLEVASFVYFADYFVIVTVSNRRQGQAVAEAIEESLEARGLRCLHAHGLETGRWIVQDFGSIVVHLFEPEARAYYDFDRLWTDAPRIAWKARGREAGVGTPPPVPMAPATPVAPASPSAE